MCSNDAHGRQTEGTTDDPSEVLETSAPVQVPDLADTSGLAVTPLSRPDDTGRPIGQLRTEGPDVADRVRDARRGLGTSPTLNAITIGHRSAHLQAALAPVRDEIYRRTLSDMGVGDDGRDGPSEALRVTARNFATLDVLAETFWTWLEDRGPLTSKGKTRSAVTALLSIIDRQTKLAATLGLDRRTKDLASMSLGEYLASRKHQHQQQPPEDQLP